MPCPSTGLMLTVGAVNCLSTPLTPRKWVCMKEIQCAFIHGAWRECFLGLGIPGMKASGGERNSFGDLVDSQDET